MTSRSYARTSINYMQRLASEPPAGAEHGEGVLFTSDPTVELPIQIAEDTASLAALDPHTVMDVFRTTVKKHGSKVALRVKRHDSWVEWTYSQYFKECCAFAKALISLGIERFAGVSILGFNSPEWFIANCGAIFGGSIASGIYTTNGPEACYYICDHSSANVIVVDSDEQMQKILSIRHRLPHCKAVVQWLGEPSTDEPGVYSFREFLRLGSRVKDEELQQRMDCQRPGHCCTLIYTSGTTGNPKAVMLSHDNITWTAAASNTLVSPTSDDQIVSYLPLSHVAAQMADLHTPLAVGGTVSFAQPDALKGSLVETLTDVRPTVMLGVPRVWEKIEERLRAVGAANTGIKKSLGDWAKQVGLEGTRAKLAGREDLVPWGWTIANAVVFANVKKALGLDRCRLKGTGAAPISMKTLEYFMSLDMPLYELYGMSETTGPHTVNYPGCVRIGSVGVAMPGVEVHIDQKDEKGNGEICMRGRNVFMGYMHNREATLSTIDSQGYLHSGDLGRLDSDGFLYITGRLKELIITAGGENVAPVLIEDAIKEELPCASNVMIVGDQRKYLTCLITLQTEADEDGNPTTQLSQASITYASDNGSSATSTLEAASCSAFCTAVEAAISRANDRAISKAQRVQKFAILENDFSVASGELTPTMKLKRRVVLEKYAGLIERMYSDTYVPTTASHMAKL